MTSGSHMASSWIRNIALPVLGLALISRTSGLAISYCSPDNTAGSFHAVYNQFQTNAQCQGSCSGYAFAVLQGQNCWCSDYAPANQVSTYSCNQVCPGWPDDWCGSTAQGLYGYYGLDGSYLKGTAGASSANSGSSVSNTPSNIPSNTGSSEPAPSTSSSSGGSSSLTIKPSVQSTTRTPSSTAFRPPTTVPAVVPDSSTTSSSSSSTITHSTASEVYTSVTTVTGVVRTILVTPTPTSDSTLGQGTAINSNGGGISTGTVVGIVVGVALGIGLIIGVGVWFCLRRRHERNMEAMSAADDSSAHGNTGIPSRQVSQMSSAGLLSKAPRIFTSGLPSGSNPRSADTFGSNLDRRSVGTDQRLNPYAIYAHDESRHSNVSLQDNQDYSRQLRVANPDP